MYVQWTVGTHTIPNIYWMNIFLCFQHKNILAACLLEIHRVFFFPFLLKSDVLLISKQCLSVDKAVYIWGTHPPPPWFQFKIRIRLAPTWRNKKFTVAFLEISERNKNYSEPPKCPSNLYARVVFFIWDMQIRGGFLGYCLATKNENVDAFVYSVYVLLSFLIFTTVMLTWGT